MASHTRDEHLKSLLEALQRHQGQTVEVETIAVAASYKTNTLKAYLRKNMLVPRVTMEEDGRCRVGDLTAFSIGDLRRALSQRANRYTWEHLGVTELVSALLDRSRTNAGLALELINRPELVNRLDAFVLLFHTAWEQLLKASLEHQDRGSIFTGGTSAGGRPATIGMHQVLERSFPSTKDPIRRNIEWIKEMRDGASHLLVPEVTSIATRYFQASILNYIRRFQEVTSESPFRFEGTGLLTLGVAYASPTLEALRVNHGEQAAEVKALIERLENEAEDANDAQFAVSIRYELLLEKKPGPDAIRLVNDPQGHALHRVIIPKDPREKWPYRATECVPILTRRTGVKWNLSAVSVVAAHLRVQSTNNECHYLNQYGKSTFHQYSDEFIDLVVQRHKQQPDLIELAYKHRRK